MKDVIDDVKSCLTDEELKNENKMREQQVREIMKLVQMQEDQLGLWTPSDVQSQLKMYM